MLTPGHVPLPIIIDAQIDLLEPDVFPELFLAVAELQPKELWELSSV